MELAEFLTTTPLGVTQDWVDELRSVGWEDQADKLSFKDDMAPKVFGKIAPHPKPRSSRRPHIFKTRDS